MSLISKQVSTTNKTATNKTLTEEQTKKTKKYSILDGSAWSVMYGFGEQYVVPFAIRLGATNSEIGILGTVPSFIGSLSQLIGAKLIDTYKNRKKIVTLFVIIQAFLFIPLFIIPFLTKSVFILTIMFSAYLILSNMIGPSWSSWIGDIIPENQRASYFSRRNKYVVGVSVLSILFAGLTLNYFAEINIWTGFGILFSIAFIGRVVSWYYLNKQFEPTYVYDPKTYFSFTEFIKKMPRTTFGNFVIYRSLMAFSVMIAAPFFAVFMLKNLEFSYIQYTTIILTPLIVRVFTISYWGKYSQKFGTRNIMIVSGLLIATIPLWWFLGAYVFKGLILFYALICAEIISGFAWAGFELTTFNYILETATSEKRARCFAYFNAIFGVAVLLGGLLGSLLVLIIPDIFGLNNIMIVFLLSALARFIIAGFFTNKIKEIKISKNISDKKLFFELIFAKPLNNVFHYATLTIINTERDVKNLAGKTIEMTDEMTDFFTRPLKPYIEEMSRFIDKIPIQKKLKKKTRQKIFIKTKKP